MSNYGAMAGQVESEPRGQQDILTKEEIDSLKEYCEIFDKIMVSKNPAVREAWKNVSLLVGLTQPSNEGEDPRLIGPRNGGPFSRLAQTVERSLMIQKEMAKHVSGLQYQIDSLKEEMKKKKVVGVNKVDWVVQEESQPGPGEGGRW